MLSIVHLSKCRPCHCQIIWNQHGRPISSNFIWPVRQSCTLQTKKSAVIEVMAVAHQGQMMQPSQRWSCDLDVSKMIKVTGKCFLFSLFIIYIYIHICFEDFWRISRNHQESRRPQNFYPDDHKTDVHNVQGLRRSRPCIHGSSLCITVSPQISTSTSTAWSVPVLPIPEIQKKEFCHTGWLFQQNSFWF